MRCSVHPQLIQTKYQASITARKLTLTTRGQGANVWGPGDLGSWFQWGLGSVLGRSVQKLCALSWSPYPCAGLEVRALGAPCTSHVSCTRFAFISTTSVSEYLQPYIYISIHPSIRPSVYLSVYLSIYLSISTRRQGRRSSAPTGSSPAARRVLPEAKAARPARPEAGHKTPPVR